MLRLRTAVLPFLAPVVAASCSSVASAPTSLVMTELTQDGPEATEETAAGPADEPTSEGAKSDGDFLGPSSTGAQIADDAAPKESLLRSTFIQRTLSPYFDWKKRIADEYGFGLGMDYTAAFFDASDGPGETDAAGGVFRVFGSWKLVGRDRGANGGSLVWKVENRHALGTDATPNNLGFQLGYAGLIGPIYSDPRWQLTNMYWKHSWDDGKTNVVAGVVDPTDYLNIYGLVNPWTAFSNLAFLTDATIATPNQGFGAAVGTMLTDQVYLVAGVSDANGDPTRPEDVFESFFDDAELFSHVEIGLVDSFDRRYFDNTHITLWHADEREAAATPDGWGAAFSWTRFIDDTWMPFVRAGYADDGGSVLEASLGGGVGYYFAEQRDLFGVGLSVGRPNETTFAPDLDEQWTGEVFYRIQMSPNFALTPDVQVIVDPALNPDEDVIYVLGVRARLAL